MIIHAYRHCNPPDVLMAKHIPIFQALCWYELARVEN
jgi:hypothetical protein